MRAAVLALLAACGPQAQSVATPPPRVAAVDASVAIAAPADAPPPSQDEILAAIQQAMGDLDAVAHQCWAAAAAVRFDIEGAFEARISVARAAGERATIEVVTDATHAPTLAACMTDVLARYPWAPPLRGQTIQLPFKFRAPDMQNVIDRRLVPSAAQGGVAVGTLLDEANTGREAASMFEVAIAPNASTGARVASRAELWYFAAPATVNGNLPVAAGDMMFVAPGVARDIAAAGGGELHAMVVMVPGGREGSARAGALPTAAVVAGAHATGKPVLAAAHVQRFGPLLPYADAGTPKGNVFTAGILSPPDHSGPPDEAKRVAELMYVLAGSATLSVAGVSQPLTASSVTQVPAGVRFAITDPRGFRAVVVDVPAEARP